MQELFVNRQRWLFNSCLLAMLVPAAGASAGPQFSVLYNFKGPAAADGALPVAGVIMDAGVLFGTTLNGGAGGCIGGCGTVYQVVPPALPGGVWTETVLHDFTNLGDGAFPDANLVREPATGALLGAASAGGQFLHGTVFQMTPPTQGTDWGFTTLYAFGATAADGQAPEAGLFAGPGGSFFGTTHLGGRGANGTAYQLSPPRVQGNPWTEAILHNFTGGGDGGLPDYGPMTTNGTVLYNTTYATSVAYQLSPPSPQIDHWTEKVLHTLSYADGDGPYAGLVESTGGALYGVAAGGGIGYGTVFQLTPPANGSSNWTFKVIHKFAGGSKGAGPIGGLAVGTGGVLYGTTSIPANDGSSDGTVFELSPQALTGTWHYTVLHNFTGPDGSMPEGQLVIDTNGVLYGTASAGGSAGAGVVFSVKP